MKVPVCDKNGKKVEEITLDTAVFGEKINEAVVYQTVRAQRDALRRGTASTKTRSEVAGGGTKPWRQKGTGRARVGSIRSPIWKGGGIIFGPKPKEHKHSVPKKVRKLAIKSALSAKVKNSEVLVIDKFDLKKPSTKKAKEILEKAGVTKNAMIVLTKDEDNVVKSVRNLPTVKVCTVSSLGAYGVIDNELLVFTRKSLTQLTEALGNEKAKE